MKLGALCRAGAAFLKTLVRRQAATREFSANGHPVLEGWDHSPEESVLGDYREVASQARPLAKAVLFGVAGNHLGEAIALPLETVKVGTSSDCEIVMTPLANKERGTYRLVVNGKISLYRDSGEPFLVNGVPETKAELLDYDEIELMGNRFVFLYTGSVSEAAKPVGKPHLAPVLKEAR